MMYAISGYVKKMIWPHTLGLIVVLFNGLILYFKNMQKSRVSTVLEQSVRNAWFTALEKPVRNTEVFQWNMFLLSIGNDSLSSR
jgi:hypothetical protein